MSTFKDMLDRVQDATLRGGSGQRVQIMAELNEAIKQVDALVRPLISSSVEVVLPNQGDYKLSTDFAITDLTSIRDVVYTPTSGNQPRSLRETTPDVIRSLRQTSATSYWSDCYALDGLDLLMLYPVSSSTGDSVTIWYVPREDDLVNPTDVPKGLPPEWHDLYEYACIPRSMRQTSPEEVMRYAAMYEKRLGDYRKWRNRRSGARSRTVVPKQGYRRLPHDPSTDLGYR